MMEMVAYMQEAKKSLLSSLEQDVQNSLKRLSYLLDVYDFNAVDMELNQTTLMWPKKLDPIFEQNEQVTLTQVGITNNGECEFDRLWKSPNTEWRVLLLINRRRH